MGARLRGVVGSGNSGVAVNSSDAVKSIVAVNNSVALNSSVAVNCAVLQEHDGNCSDNRYICINMWWVGVEVRAYMRV